MQWRRGVVFCLWSGLVLTVMLGVSSGLWALLASVRDPVAVVMKGVTLLAAAAWVVNLLVLIVCLAFFVLALDRNEIAPGREGTTSPAGPATSSHETSADEEAG